MTKGNSNPRACITLVTKNRPSLFPHGCTAHLFPKAAAVSRAVLERKRGRRYYMGETQERNDTGDLGLHLALD